MTENELWCNQNRKEQFKLKILNKTPGTSRRKNKGINLANYTKQAKLQTLSRTELEHCYLLDKLKKGSEKIK